MSKRIWDISPPVDLWDSDLTAFALQTIERLADNGVLLVGIDSAAP